MQTTLLSSPSLLLPLARRTALQQQWCIPKHTGASSLNTLDYIPLRKKAGHSLLLNSDPSSADDTRETISIFTFMQIAIESSKQKGFRQPFLAHALYFCGKYRLVFSVTFFYFSLYSSVHQQKNTWSMAVYLSEPWKVQQTSDFPWNGLRCNSQPGTTDEGEGHRHFCGSDLTLWMGFYR